MATAFPTNLTRTVYYFECDDKIVENTNMLVLQKQLQDAIDQGCECSSIKIKIDRIRLAV